MEQMRAAGTRQSIGCARGRLMGGVYGLLGSLVIAGCGLKVIKPMTDSTPPKLRWKLEDFYAGKTIEIKGSASYHTKPGHVLRITLFAEDPQGVHRISLTGGYTVECRAAESPTAQNLYGTYFPEGQTLSPDSNNMVMTLFFIVNTYEYVTTCNEGYEFKQTQATLTGTGENYFGGVTEAGLHILITP